MAIPDPHASRKRQAPNEPFATLQETLDALLEFTGAAAGWIGLLRPDGRLYFPARVGTFSEAWLTLQQGRTSLWGFEVREGPTILNDPPALPILGDPPLRNLLTCSLRRGVKPAGQLVLVNKPNGFTSHDATALHLTAHLLCRQLVQQGDRAQQALSAALLRQALDQVQEGVLIVDDTGNLIFANATWGQWTGYAREELCDRPPPFPFWVSHAELAALGDLNCTLPDTFLSGQGTGAHRILEPRPQRGLLPFQHRNHSLFWCQMETTTAEIGGQAVTIACLRRLPAGSGPPGAAHGERATASPWSASPPRGPTAPSAPLSDRVAQSLPFSLPAHGAVNFRETKGMALLLRPGGIIELWDERWEELTGLTRQDLAGISSELFLDWLFPRQRDRSFVADLFHQSERRGAQAWLEVAGRTGNLPILCTLLPVRASELREEASASGNWSKGQVTDAPLRVADAWLILVCEPEVTATEENRVQRFVPVHEGSATARCLSMPEPSK